MNRKAIIKSIVAILGSVYVTVLLQSTVFTWLAMGWITPNLLLVLTAMFGIMLGSKYGMVCGFLCGIMLDLFNGSYFGMYALVYLYLGFLNGFFSTVFYGDDIKLPLFLVAASDLLYGGVFYIVFLFLKQEMDVSDFMFYLMNVIIPEAVYTAVVSLLYYYPMKRLAAWVDREEKRGTRIIA